METKPFDTAAGLSGIIKKKLGATPHSIKQWQLESIGVHPGATDLTLNDAYLDNHANVTMETKFSTWTPRGNKVSNQQLFQERTTLICHWFDLWTDRQRKQFIHAILQRCSRSQLKFTRDWFTETVPITKLDFTTALPRFLSLYIFSFLNPKELCKAAKVSWHWKFLAEQDCLWSPKCVKRGWFLPYSPADNEYGAWKKHYINCAADIDYLIPREAADTYGTLNAPTADAEEVDEKMREKLIRMTIRQKIADHKKALRKSRPAWLSNNLSSGALKASLHKNKLQASLNRPELTAALLLIRENVLLHETLSKQMMEESITNPSYSPILEKQQVTMALKTLPKRKNVSSGSPYPALSQRHYSSAQQIFGSSQLAQRLILISSNMPAYEVLLDSVKVGVIPILYEHDGVTLESLLYRIEKMLQGLKAQSIGVFAEGDAGEIDLVQGWKINEKNILNHQVREFWEKLAGFAVAKTEGGCLDIFNPLAASEAGVDLINKISTLTGLEVSTPTGISAGSHRHVCSEWLGKRKATLPCVTYFNESKLLSWCRLADVLQEALKTVRKQLRPYLRETQKEVCGRIIGHFMYESMSLAKIQANRELALALSEGLVAVSRERCESPLEFLAAFLIQRCKGADGRTPNLTFLTESQSSVPLNDFIKDDDQTKNSTPEKMEDLAYLDTKLLRDSADKRTPFARELVQSEKNYVQTLEIVRDVYAAPLQAALSSNRAILSAANVQIIFTDALAVLEMNRTFLQELKERLNEWTPSQCIGDLFLKFGTGLKTYTNFFNNYPVVLKTIDKCRESIPAFWAFLRRHDKTVGTKMMRLQELLLYPSRRFEEYVSLLNALRLHTTADHPDRADLSAAIQKMKQYRDFVQQLRQNGDRDSKLSDVQQAIQGCPNLQEANRYLIQTQDVSQLICPNMDINPSLRIYEHIRDLRLFLFNDALVITMLSVSHLPFEFASKTTCHFLASVVLHRLIIEDIPDTKYIKNAFTLQGPKRQWICITEDEDDKFTLLSGLQSAVNAAVEQK
ncbi:epithelial cell-transforming sequence 2 oncogene-like [Erpetoichthys calabaricus]|nr:epithelial cell-transforming sequence 2 oncogene-like [Erpetoichthys calabaricus]XP_051775241.1 epithelial cell-transforming sequence 2 oncogene-like [Erpetoichthys calabaricus]